MITNKNPLLMIDIYKLGHMLFYKKGTKKVYSYLCPRSDKKSKYTVFFGLQPYLKILETIITTEHANEFFQEYFEVLGYEPNEKVKGLINGLIGRPLPLHIKAVPEGTVIDVKNVLMTVTSTDEKYFWLGGFFESLLLKVWNTCSVCTGSHKFKKLATKLTQETSDSEFLLPYLVHSFGYRGVSSENTAELSGAAHLVNFVGTDDLVAIKFLKNNYGATGVIGQSVAASEHSIHQSFGPTAQDELDYVNNMMEEVPTGIVSVVSDAYDYWRMLTVTLPAVKDKILARDGKYVVRPDSGDPLKILCGTIDKVKDITTAYGKVTESGEIYQVGDKYYELEVNRSGSIFHKEVSPTPEQKGTFRILDELFGSTVNSKGYKELNPKIGVIYGDGMYYERYEAILYKMKEMGYANTNLVVGIGGLLLQQHNRDDLGFAFKATFAEINGEKVELFKDPVTDPGKKSHKGLMMLTKDENGKFITVDQCSEEEEKLGFLETVFKDGKIVKEYTLSEIRERAKI